MDMNTCRIDLPAEGPDAKVRFKNFVHKEKLPFCIYADIESILKPTDKMPAFQEHQAFSIGYYMKNSIDDSKSYYKSYMQMEEGENIVTPAEWFVNELKEIATKLENLIQNPKPMIMTENDHRTFQQAKCCHICGKAFKSGEKKIKDHCHYTGIENFFRFF